MLSAKKVIGDLILVADLQLRIGLFLQTRIQWGFIPYTILIWKALILCEHYMGDLRQ